MKKITLLVLLAALAALPLGAQNSGQRSKRSQKSPLIEGCQKVRQSDFRTYDRFENFSSKSTDLYFAPFDYSRFPALARQDKPDWGELKPVMNYLEKVSRAPITMCAIYAVNPEITDRDERERLLRQAADEARIALEAFDKWKSEHGMRNKATYNYTEVDYRYFKGAAYYNEQPQSEVVHVGLILYLGTKKRAIFETDTNTRTFKDIRFFPNDATIVESWTEHLDDLARYLKENDRKSVLLTGYADNQGTEAYAVGLSRQRAVEVKKALQMRGIDATRIEIDARGAEDPVGDNDTYEGRVANNRVTIKVR